MKAECYCGRWLCFKCGSCHDCDRYDMPEVARCAQHPQAEYVAAEQRLEEER